MSILGWILFGLVVGVVAKLLMPGRDPGGMMVTILMGICGVLIRLTPQAACLGGTVKAIRSAFLWL